MAGRTSSQPANSSSRAIPVMRISIAPGEVWANRILVRRSIMLLIVIYSTIIASATNLIWWAFTHQPGAYRPYRPTTITIKLSGIACARPALPPPAGGSGGGPNAAAGR
jgi:hypothetical protein